MVKVPYEGVVVAAQQQTVKEETNETSRYARMREKQDLRDVEIERQAYCTWEINDEGKSIVHAGVHEGVHMTEPLGRLT